MELGRKNETELLTDAIGMDAFEHAPATSADALGAATRGQQALAAAIPPGEMKDYPGQPALVSADEQHKFMVEYTIATNPQWVFDRADDGTLEPNMLNTLRKYYPQMHADITNRIREQADKATTYQQRLLISSLIDQPTSASTEPMARAILSAAPAGQQDPQAAAGPGQRAPASHARPNSSRALQGHGLSSASGAALTSTQKTAFDVDD